MTRKSAFGLPNIAGIFFVTLRHLKRALEREVLTLFLLYSEYCYRRKFNKSSTRALQRPGKCCQRQGSGAVVPRRIIKAGVVTCQGAFAAYPRSESRAAVFHVPLDSPLPSFCPPIAEQPATTYPDGIT